MSPLPDIHYSPGFNRLKISGCRRRAQEISGDRPRNAFSQAMPPWVAHGAENSGDSGKLLDNQQVTLVPRNSS
jgi:hypothetical protein